MPGAGATGALREGWRSRLGVGVGDEPFELIARAWAVAGSDAAEPVAAASTV